MKPADIKKKYHCDDVDTKFVNHTDVMLLDNVGSKMKKDSAGFLSGSAPVAKVGIMSYLMADGSVLRELVPAETLFDEDSMASLRLKPVTDSHPSERQVNSDNAGITQVGYTGEIIAQDGHFLTSNMVITDQRAIDSVNGGKQELSPGYQAELVFQKGTFNGDKYDAIQIGRKYNHLAIVDNARGGADIRLLLDSKDMHLDGFETSIAKNDKNKQTPKKEYSMKYVIDGIEYDADQQVVNQITKIDNELTASKASAVEAKAKLDSTEAERDTLKAKVDELEKRDIEKEITDGIEAKLALVQKASKIVDKADELANLDSRSIKLKMIEKRFPEIHAKIDENTTDVYIDAIVDAIEVKTDDSNINDQRGITAPVQKTDKKEDAASARIKMNKADEDAWKTKPESK